MARITDDPHDPELTRGPDSAPVSQAPVYLVADEALRAGGFIRPVRTSYRHETCGTVTSMGLAIAETYATEPGFYGSTFCVACRMHRPVGPAGEFVWLDDDTKVGT